MSFTSRLVGLLAASACLGGCCNEVTGTQCFAWDASATCPSAEEAAGKLDRDAGEVKGPGKFWPEHEYLIEGKRVVEPASCCYTVTSTVCTRELH